MGADVVSDTNSSTLETGCIKQGIMEKVPTGKLLKQIVKMLMVRKKMTLLALLLTWDN